ncbi:MAG: PDZ domain-containing protein [Xanthomonadales bacterium]|nr:PDZ domain-containing protein [Xanthomonadales bacterium]
MRAMRHGLIALLLGLGSTLVQADAGLAAEVAAATQARMQSARDAVLPYVVSIFVVREDAVQGRAELRVSAGSGTIISRDGHVATNAHVTENGKRFRVVLADKRELSAILVGEDALSDIAVLKIRDVPEAGFPFAHFAGDNKLQAGDVVMAMGAPWGMAHSVSQGVVNNPERLLLSLFQDEADYEQQLGQNQPTARFYAWIQHDASISPGNSGGPLVSMDGEIVGINTRGNSMGGDMAFAIPSPVAARIVADLIREGTVPRSFFGFGVRSLKRSGFDRGVLVSSVIRESPAAEAGLEAGDRIIAIDGEAVTVAEPEQVPPFLRALTERRIGAAMAVTLLRDGTERKTSLVSTSYPPDLGHDLEVKAWGVTFTELTPSVARSRYLNRDVGLLVTGVLPGKRAATAHPPWLVGDVVHAIDGKPVGRRIDMQALDLDNGGAAPRRVVDIERNGAQLISVLDAKPARDEDKKLRELPKAWIGIETQPITATTAALIAGPSSGGYRITRVYDDAPAAKAGVQVGDVLTSLAGAAVPVTGDSGDEPLQQRIRETLLDEPLALGLWRSGKALQVRVTPVAAPAPASSLTSRSIDWLDLGVRNIGFYDRVSRGIAADSKGVIVDNVAPGGLAGLAHLAAGDVVLRVNGTVVSDVDRFEQLTDRKARQAGTPLSFLVLRGSRTRLLYLDAEWEQGR